MLLAMAGIAFLLCIFGPWAIGRFFPQFADRIDRSLEERFVARSATKLTLSPFFSLWDYVAENAAAHTVAPLCRTVWWRTSLVSALTA